MSYTVLARRYRSRSFDEVVGQGPIAQTLKKAVELNRLGHAYLFVGTRGVGKTSMARIFAKAINAPGDEPKEIAEAIMQGRDIDVVEIDAASNSKVEETRELIANSVYRPLRGPKKIYIIDEVHMLSAHAFNALLKTMEEPPAHVVFILCTTETHKVPATIQSRCQRFDFRNISTAKIAGHLGEVVQKEGINAEPELLHMVARLGNGSMRDALSLLDRLIASGEKALTPKLLEDLLGIPDRQLVSSLVEALASGDTAASLKGADEMLHRGVSVEQVLSALADHFRDLLILSTCGQESELVELSGDARREAAAQAAKFDPAGLVHMIALCESVQRNIRMSAAPRAILDAAIVRLSLSEKFADVTALITGGGTGPDAAPSSKARAASNGGVPAKKR